MKAAPTFGYEYKKIEALFVDVVKHIITRKDTSTMAQLTILCRRYAGFRPSGCVNDDAGEAELGKFHHFTSCVNTPWRPLILQI